MPAAVRDSWKTLPLPTKREALGFSALYTDLEADKLRLGLIPHVMEDKWFIFSMKVGYFFTAVGPAHAFTGSGLTARQPEFALSTHGSTGILISTSARTLSMTES